MYNYAISDVRFIKHGITLQQTPKLNAVFPVLEVNTGTLYFYSVCGYFPIPQGYYTELLPMFSHLPQTSSMYLPEESVQSEKFIQN